MVATDQVREISTDARALQADAVEMLALRKVRNAAEKAWAAPKLARIYWRVNDRVLQIQEYHEVAGRTFP